MKLIKLKVKNFRCYKDEFEISFDDLTAIIGRNDVGKSSLMDALAIFFEDAKIEKSDCNVFEPLAKVEITCVFSNLPEELTIDDSSLTSLQNEYLVDACGHLQIRKIYDCSLALPKQIATDALALHPSADGYSDLLQLKRDQLKSRAQSLGVNLDSIPDQRINSLVRLAIWQNCAELNLQFVPVSLEKEGAKQVWSSLILHMPSFVLFKSDRASSDQDSEAQDPLRSAIKDAIKSVENELQQIQQRVEEEVKKIAEHTVKKVQEMDPALATTLNPIITTKKWDSLFQTSITGDNGISLNKRGSGVRRLILLNFFRAKAEKIATDRNSSIIYAIEEPETSQHPNNQRMLMSALMQLTVAEGSQVVITTHTPMLARGLPQNSIRYIEEQANSERIVVTAGENDINRRIAKSLGILPDHTVKLFIGLEGKNDINFLNGISKILISAGEDVPNLEELEARGEIIFFPLGGSNLALWASRLNQLNRPEYYIFDRDMMPPTLPKYHDVMRDINGRQGSCAVCTSRRELENYIHSDAISEAYIAHNITLNLSQNFQSFDDVPTLVAKAVYESSGNDWGNLTDHKKIKSKVDRAKLILNSDAVLRMTPQRLTEIDQENDIRRWLRDIQMLLNGESLIGDVGNNIAA